jgi:di/tripeptidase
MQEIVDFFNEEYKDIAKATIVFTEKMPMFEKNADEFLPNLFETSAKQVGIEPEISSFHAGAETHIYANKTNAKGEKFSPYLLGLATVCNMHSAREYVDYKTMIKGQELLSKLFENFNN